jgi:hypothetical protein
MKDKSCFIIPVWPPDYHYLSFLNDIPYNSDFDIYLILSYHNDLVLLESLNFNKIYKVIIIEDYLDSSIINNILKNTTVNQGIITLKKYIALDILKDKYSYLCTVDSEIDFVSFKNINEKFKSFCENKVIIGSTVDSERAVSNPFYVIPQPELLKVVNKINDESLTVFNNETRNEIRNKISNNFYFWFSDLPVYDSKILTNFFNFINFNINTYYEFSKKLNYYIFDFICYAYYCILYENYETLDIKSYGINRNWSLESMPYDTYLDVLKIGYKPMSLIYNTYLENKEKINDIILIYHKNDGKYVYL